MYKDYFYCSYESTYPISPSIIELLPNLLFKDLTGDLVRNLEGHTELHESVFLHNFKISRTLCGRYPISRFIAMPVNMNIPLAHSRPT